MARQPKLALIDSHALIHRAYHALPPMTTRKGMPTNAVYGFVTMLLKMFATLKPTHVVAAFDVKGPTFREKEYEEYKAHRKEADEELIVQFDLVKRVLQAFGIPVIFKKGFEADDVIGTIVTRLGGQMRTVIITGDMDTLQLVDEDTGVFTLKRGITDTILYTPELVREKYGFGPEHITDYKGLAGDPSDNIKGVAGVGQKTAQELIKQFGSVEEIFADLNTVPEKYRRKLKGQEKAALQSKRLATIARDVPIEFDLTKAKLAGYDSSKVRKVFEELEFRSLLAKLPRGGTEIQPTLLAAASTKHNTQNTKSKLPDHYHLVQTKKEAEELKKNLKKAKIVAFDTENDALGAREYPIVGMSFALPGHAYYVPVNRESVKEWRDILEDEEIKKTGHNLKYDMKVLAQSGVRLRGVVFDSMLASYLLHPGARAHGLDTLSVQELNHHPIPLTSLIGSGKDQKKVSEVPMLDLARYAAEDAELALRLYEKLKEQLEREKLERVLEELEVPLVSVLADMELSGVQVDAKQLTKLQKKVAQRIEELKKNIWAAAGGEFNINSTQQLREVLFNKLKLSTVNIARKQSGFSTAASELNKLMDQHLIIEMLSEYRELSKLQNTYIEVLPELVDKKTGRIYGEFNQVVAATGRISSQNPNLQNIPARTELGQEIRAAFAAPAGALFVKADYSQIELRLAAHLSQDEKMLAAFRAGADIHAATGAALGISRRAAKTLNFGVLYGMGSQSFARAAKVSVEEARSFIGRYRQQYSGLTKFIEATLEEARATQVVTTMFGRKRLIPEINSRAPVIRAAAERAAFNFPLQGSAADILKKAMITLHKHMQKKFPKAKLILTVHDELVAEVPEKEAKSFAKDMKKIMESVTTLDVPLVVDMAVGKNWRDMEKVDV